MKTAILWIGAGLFALYLLLRYRRRANRRLAGKVSTRFVHQVSVLLVAAGCGSSSKQETEAVIQPEESEDATTGQEEASDSFPEFGDVRVSKELKSPYPDYFPYALEPSWTNNWLAVQAKHGRWAQFKQQVVSGKELAVETSGLRGSFSAFVALYSNDNATVGDLLSVLSKMESKGIYDTWLAGYLYQRASSLPVETETANLFGRIESHSRVAESFVVALAHSKVVQPRAWMSKAAPPAGYNRNPSLESPEQFLKQAAVHYAIEDGGSWETQSRVALKLEEGSAVLLRRDQSIPLKGELFLERLDVLVAKSACKLRLAYLGIVDVPEGTKLTSSSIHSLLSPSAKRLLNSYVVGALAGDPSAVRRLSALAPLAVLEMREALKKDADATGAATLRSLLFDTSW